MNLARVGVWHSHRHGSEIHSNKPERLPRFLWQIRPCFPMCTLHQETRLISRHTPAAHAPHDQMPIGINVCFTWHVVFHKSNEICATTTTVLTVVVIVVFAHRTWDRATTLLNPFGHARSIGHFFCFCTPVAWRIQAVARYATNTKCCYFLPPYV